MGTDDKQSLEDQKQFFLRHRRYAISRYKDDYIADEFPAFCWEMTHIRGWKCDVKKLWSHFCREKLGALGSKKASVELAIQNRRVTFLRNSEAAGDYLDYIEDRKKEEILRIPNLSKQDQIIVCLLQCGFSFEEIFHHLIDQEGPLQKRIDAFQERMKSSQSVKDHLNLDLNHSFLQNEEQSDYALYRRRSRDLVKRQHLESRNKISQAIPEKDPDDLGTPQPFLSDVQRAAAIALDDWISKELFPKIPLGN